jgi:lipopolysaccharide biosynthesis glycosyltransferase
MLRIFIGYDPRQPVSYNVLQQSIFRTSSKPVAITPLILNPSKENNLHSDKIVNQLPLKRTGLTHFTFSRFLVPYLCNYEGWALFLDIDMLVKGDIAELFAMADDKYSVMVSKNKHKFEWASAMLFNCAKCKVLTPEYIETANGLHTIDWVKEEEIGDFPREWNHLVGYDKPRNDPKLIHFTQGNPYAPETWDSEHGDAWREEAQFGTSAWPWVNLMGHSVHAARLPDGQIVPKYKVEPPQ